MKPTLETPAVRAAEDEARDSHDQYAPRPLSLGENVKLTVKVFAVIGLVIALLWGITAMTAGQ